MYDKLQRNDLIEVPSYEVNLPPYEKISLLSWAHFLNDGISNYLPGVLPAILISLGFSVSMAGILMAALLIGQAFQPLAGLLSDHIGGRSFTLLGLAGSTIAGALVAFAPNTVLLIFILLLIGISNSLFHPQTLAGVRRLSRERQGMAMAVFLTGGELGRGLWPLIASLLVMEGGIKSLWILVIPGLITLPFLRSKSIKLPPRRRDSEKVRWDKHMKPLSVLVIFSGLRNIMLFAISTFVPIIWHERGGSLTGGAAFITVMLIVGIGGNLIGGHLGDRHNRYWIIGLGTIGATLAMIVFMIADGIWLWILIALVGIGLFMTFPLTLLIGQDIVPENRSFGSGMALGLSNGLGALGVMALGPVAAAWGASAALWVSIACSILSLPFLLSLYDWDQTA